MIDLGEPIKKYNFIFESWKDVENSVVWNEKQMMEEYKQIEDVHLRNIIDMIFDIQATFGRIYNWN